MSKDGFGDKLRDKEKAEEDRYFAQENAKKLAELNKEKTPPQLGLCPKCGIALEAHKVDDVAVDVCGKCAGMWLDIGELEHIISRESESWASKWIRSILDGK